MHVLTFVHTFLAINISLFISYLLVRSLIYPPLLLPFSQRQQLVFSRVTLLLSLCLPLIMLLIPIPADFSMKNSFILSPLLTQASTTLLSHAAEHSSVNKLIDHHFHLSINLPILLLLTSIATGLFYNYVSSVRQLFNLLNTCQPYHQIGRVKLLFSDFAESPFCWSLFNSYYIVIPMLLTENTLDMKIAIKHELQHIRQRDTNWQHYISILKIVFFYNPSIYLWYRLLKDLQEFACDEKLTLQSPSSRIEYAQCLLNTAKHINSQKIPHPALGMTNFTNNHSTILKRRITMIFNYQPSKHNKLFTTLIHFICVACLTTCAFAMTDTYNSSPLSARQLSAIIEKSHLQIAVMPEVITEINNIRGSEQARAYMKNSLARMEEYKPYISAQLKTNHIPQDLLALPLTESGFNVHAKSPVGATGIWQFIPSTAKHFNLTVNASQDDRLNTALATQAAIEYLNLLHNQFHDWRLAVMAYEIGETNLQQLIDIVGSQEPWTLARSPHAPVELKKYLTQYDTAVIIIKNPQLI